MKYRLSVDFEDGVVLQFSGTDLDGTVQRYQQLTGSLQVASMAAPHQAQEAPPWSPAPQAQQQEAPQSDPWGAPPPGQYAQPAAPAQQAPAASYAQPAGPPFNPGYPQAQMPAQAQPQQVPGVPMCNHGPRKFVPAGVSKRTNNPYPAFWSCQADRNDPNKCASQAA